MPPAAPVWKARTAVEPDPLILALCAGRDLAGVAPADAALLPHDLHVNLAHAVMLGRCKVIDKATLARLLRALMKLEQRASKGRFGLDPAAEDVHTNVETAVAGLAGADAAGRLHTGRSRNDQAATDMRLWLRERLAEGIEQVASLAEALAKRARQDAAVVCPGFTHMQPAQVTSLGHLWASHAHALARDLETLQACTPLVGRCPLGAAAAFGTPWPIDREFTAEILGFDAPEENTLDAVTNRWEPEAHVSHAWSVTLTHLATLGADVICLSTPPREWVRLHDAHVTGSSIMPQKRNPDLAEVTRARAAACLAGALAIVSTPRGQLSGYNRDLQWTKYHIMDAWGQFADVPEAWQRVIEGLTVDKRAMRAACDVGFLEAAELADFLAMQTDEPFRRLHGVVARAVAACEGEGRLTLGAVNAALAQAKIKFQMSPQDWDLVSDPAARLAQRNHTGSPSPARVRSEVKELLSDLAAAREVHWKWRHRHASAQRRLVRMVERATR
jgi:argininosuccinate lyase